LRIWHILARSNHSLSTLQLGPNCSPESQLFLSIIVLLDEATSFAEDDIFRGFRGIERPDWQVWILESVIVRIEIIDEGQPRAGDELLKLCVAWIRPDPIAVIVRVVEDIYDLEVWH
jgi:hypothetical protein